MNILISTTTNWNCGDDFIRFGVKNILNNIFPNANYIHYDRNPDYMTDYPRNQRLRSGCVSNIMNNPIEWGIIDLVVLAGSPEFLHSPLALIYSGLLDYPEIPLWAVGVGYSESKWVVPPDDNEITILKRKNTLIISRQQELSERLELLLDRGIHTLPCPGLFCFMDFPEKTKDALTILQNRESIIPEGDIAYHTIWDYRKGGYYSSDPNDMLNHIGKYEKIISQRLHGTIAGISAGARSLLDNTSFRATEAIKLFKEVIGCGGEDILPFKVRTFNNYIKIINEYAQSFIGER